CLRTAVAAGVAREKVDAMFFRAKGWVASTYPEPHTAAEAELYGIGRAEDVATLERIVARAAGPSTSPRVPRGGGL
ncbi:MAG TPA: hypothetical protein VFF65_02390, partial [Phycisphaerales bacterium]|nr:hypothetical protein [Phycisphaerales bacterium]